MNTTTIIEQIKNTVASQMNLWEVDFFNYVKELEEYVSKTVFKTESYINNPTELNKLQLCEAMGYTKSMRRYFDRSVVSLKEIIKKEATHKLSKIDGAVRKKLSKTNVETVEALSFNAQAVDGFVEGSWLINNKHVFSFSTIYAGGYNIQCLHVRTIYKLKITK